MPDTTFYIKKLQLTFGSNGLQVMKFDEELKCSSGGQCVASEQ